MPWFSLQFVHAAAVSCAVCIALVSGTPEAVVAALWCLRRAEVLSQQSNKVEGTVVLYCFLIR